MTKTVFALAVLIIAPKLFAQGYGPSGFLGCYGYDPNNWAGEAGPGECVVSSGRVYVNHGVYVTVNEPPCASGPNLFVAGIVRVFKEGAAYGLSEYLGPAAQIAGEQLGDEFRKLIEGRIDPTANCQIVSVKLPARATFVRATYWHWWESAYHETDEGAATGHWSKWEGLKITDTASGPVLWAIFKNWSDNVDQPAVIHVIYKPANMDREKRRQPNSLH
jgi:hypothetical protein